MQDRNESEKGAVNNRGDNNEFEDLTFRDVVGGATLVIVVVGVAAGFYVYSNVSKDSVRLQFWVNFMFSFAALVIVVIQVAIYAQQARFMKQQAAALDAQLELSRKAIRYSDAAYITVNRAEITKRPIVGQTTEASIEFINSGNTPAYEVRTYLYFGIKPEGFTFTHEEAVAMKGTVSSAVVGGHGATLKQEVQSGYVLTQEVLDVIGKDNQYIHIWGVVLYKDVFKRSRWTRFSLALPGLLTTLFTVSPSCNDAGGED
jgi:molybdopterin-binding protein